jgi:hypothetical protein
MSFIPKAKLLLPVRRNAEVQDLIAANGTELWTSRRLIAQRIEAGDKMTLWSSRDGFDAAEGPQWPVKEVFWDADGIMNLDLALMILNPTEPVRSAYLSNLRHGFSKESVNSKGLWTVPEGEDFDALMRRGEWLK